MELDQIVLLIGLIGGLITLIALGSPIAFAMMIPGMAVATIAGGFPAVFRVAQSAWTKGTSFILLAIPLFIFMASMLHHSGVTRRLFDAAEGLVGSIRGSLAISTIIACGGFGAMCGSSVATAATIGGVAYPEMRSRGYGARLACGCLAAGGTLGILIPPSINMIIIGYVAQLSVGKLFLGGMLPGAMMVTMLSLGTLAWARMHPESGGRVSSSPWNTRIRLIRGIWPAIIVIAIVLGGIYSGAMTPTEAAGIGAMVGIVGWLLQGLAARRLQSVEILNAAKDAAITTAWIFFLIIGGAMFADALVRIGVVTIAIDWVTSLPLHPLMIIVAMQMILFVMGMFVEVLGIIMITAPMFFPIVILLGFDPIWFGILFVINTELALITPPVGLNLFVVQGVTGEEFSTVALGAAPFVGLIILGLVICIVWPELVMYLPTLLMP